MHDRAVDHHVVVEELRRTGGVRHDAADGPRDEEHVLGPVGLEPVVDRALVAQVELVTGRGEHVRIARGGEAPEHGRTNQTPVAGHEDPRIDWHRVHEYLPGRAGRVHVPSAGSQLRLSDSSTSGAPVARPTDCGTSAPRMKPTPQQKCMTGRAAANDAADLRSLATSRAARAVPPRRRPPRSGVAARSTSRVPGQARPVAAAGSMPDVGARSPHGNDRIGRTGEQGLHRSHGVSTTNGSSARTRRRRAAPCGWRIRRLR